MRLEPSEVNTQESRGRARVGKRRRTNHAAARRRVALEALEPRTLLATLPPPVVPAGSLKDISGSTGDESAPLIAVDPINSSKLVAVWVRNDPTITGNTKILVEGAFTINGGGTWSKFNAMQGVLL